MKDAFSFVIPQLQHLFQSSFDNGIFPESWAIVKTTPLPKPGDSSQVSNLRPKKISKLGLHYSFLSWVESYLSKRRQYTEVDGIKSNTKHVIFGVPQGSVLGPLLLIIFLDDHVPLWMTVRLLCMLMTLLSTAITQYIVLHKGMYKWTFLN